MTGIPFDIIVMRLASSVALDYNGHLFYEALYVSRDDDQVKAFLKMMISAFNLITYTGKHSTFECI